MVSVSCRKSGESEASAAIICVYSARIGLGKIGDLVTFFLAKSDKNLSNMSENYKYRKIR